MPGERRSSPRTRGSWLPRLAGLGAIVIIAGGGTLAYLLEFHPVTPRHVAALPTRVVSYQTVGLIAQAANAASGNSPLLQLLSPRGEPAFTPVATAEEVNGMPEWTADLMAGGTYIFIYLPTGQCLASAGPARTPQLTVQRCDLGLGQRWRRLTTGVLEGNHYFYQFASAASGKCIADAGGPATQPGGASLATCDPAQPAWQLLAFWWTAN
jgi:hypothetical protein